MKNWITGLGLGSALLGPFVVGLVLILVFGAALGGIMNLLQGGSGAVMTAAGYEKMCQQDGGTVLVGDNSGAWSTPALGEISSPYGMRVHPVTGVRKLHDGTDISGGPGNSDVGQPVYAASSGKMTVESNAAYGGHFVTITHDGGIQTQYGHMSANSVNNGDQVTAGQKIGEIGDEGYSTGAHLHFIVRVNGNTTDPVPFMTGKGVTLGNGSPTTPVDGTSSGSGSTTSQGGGDTLDTSTTTLPASWTTTSASGETVTLDRKQLEFAATVASKGQQMGVSDDGIIIALMTVFTESKWKNYASTVYPETIGKEYPKGSIGSDHDSVGLFQQRPVSGWGSPMQLLNPGYAASAFFGGPNGPNNGSPMGLLDHIGWESRPKGEVAQDVQVSGYPDRYAGWEKPATDLLGVVKGAGGVEEVVGNQNPNCPPQETFTEGFNIAAFNVLGWGHRRPGMPPGKVRFPNAMNLLSTKNISIAALQEMHKQNQRMFWRDYRDTWGACRGTQDYVVWSKAEWKAVQCERVRIPYFGGKPRNQPFVLLEQISTGEKVWYMGIHNPANAHGPARHWRADALRIERDAIKAKSEQGFPVIIAGDFNDGRDGSVSAQCMLTPLMTNAFGPSPGGCQNPRGDAPVDHILSVGQTLVSAAVDLAPKRQKISDHPMVTAVVPSEASVGGTGDCSPQQSNPIAQAGMYAPNAVSISHCMLGQFGQYVSSIGGYRPSSISGNHETGCALDIMIRDWSGAGRAGGDQMAEWIMKNRSKLGVQYVIWRQRIWSTTQFAAGWRPMGDRGSPTANHMDHVHVSVYGPRCVAEV